jgi:hypothetical protein
MQVGAALVLAVTTAIVVGGGHGGTAGVATPQEMLDQFRPGLFLALAVAAAGLVIAILPKRTARGIAPEPDFDSDSDSDPGPGSPEPEPDRIPAGV